MEAKRPWWRKGCAARERRVTTNHVGDARTRHEVLIDAGCRCVLDEGRHPNTCLVRRAKIESRSARLVGEDAVCSSTAQTNVEGDRFVEVWCVGWKAASHGIVSVGVVKLDDGATKVEPTR